MNKAQKLILSIFLSSSVFAQSNSNKLPFTFNAAYVGNILYNTSGGLQTGAAYLGIANIGLSFSTEKANLWKGGEFYLLGANSHGAEPMANLIGDFQTVSNIEASSLTYLLEFWFKQSLGPLSQQVGIQELIAEFVKTDGRGNFINSSFGIPSVFADNIPSPIFPNTALGLSLFWEISNSIMLQTFVFDGNKSDFASWNQRKNRSGIVSNNSFRS